MPNHIINIVRVTEDIEEQGFSPEEVMEFVKTERSDFDFNTIIPMPEELRDTKSPATIVPDDQYEEALKENALENKKLKEKGIILKNPISRSMSDTWIKKYKANNWYDWSVLNWGTKWNAYDIHVGSYGEFVFQTAWSHPDQVMEKLSRIFPHNTFHIAYADEDIGNNVGMYELKNGEIVYALSILKGRDAELIANVLWGANIE